MSLCGNVRVDPDRNTGLLAQFGRALSQQLEFAFTLHIEKQNAAAQGKLQFFGGLAHAGEDNLVHGLLACGSYPFELASGNDVEPPSPLPQQNQNTEIWIGFFRKAKPIAAPP